MIQGFKAFAKQLLVSGGFRITEFPRKAYRDLLTSGIGLDGCQQHSMRAQGVFVSACLLLFSHLEIVSDGKPYTALASVISGHLKPEDLISEKFVMLP
jgi:hypothetical protein